MKVIFCFCYDSSCLWPLTICQEILMSLQQFPIFPSYSLSGSGWAELCLNFPELVHTCLFAVTLWYIVFVIGPRLPGGGPQLWWWSGGGKRIFGKY